MNSNLTPIIVGTAQYTQHKNNSERLDPLSLMVKTAENAIIDTKVERIKEFIDAVYMVNIFSWSYLDAPSELSSRIGINPKQKVYLPDGGNSPQMLINRAANLLSKEDINAVIVIGAEAYYSVRKAKKEGFSLNWPERKEPKYMEGKNWHGTTDFENKYKFIIPSCSYAILETALRVKSGRSINEHNQYIGRLFERFSKIASKNPFAWTSNAYTAQEIIKPSSENRYINHPYTKCMCSNLFVDQSSAVILTTEKVAEELNINRNLWIYPMGGADLENIFSITRRPFLYDSPALRETSKLALNQAGLKLEEVDKFDLYNCFPSIVEIAMKEIGIAENDPRDLTITGGLSFFGGPWSNYSLHAITTAVELIRKNPNLKIFVLANGGYNTKQSIGIYGNKPPALPWGHRDDSKIQQSILEKAIAEPIEQAHGNLTIEAYTIIYDRFNRPKKIIVVGFLEGGSRTIAYIEDDKENLIKFEKEELVGKECEIHFDSKSDRNIAVFIK